MSEVGLELVRPVPAWAVRGSLAALAASLLAVAFGGTGPRPHAVLVVALAALVVATTVLPGLGLAALVVLVAGTRLLVGDPPALGVVLALVLLVHLTLWAGAVAARTSWRTRVELAVLVRGLREVALVQVGAQVLAVVAMLLVGVAQGDLWRAAALVAAITLAAVLLPRP
ncbi:hypothetical protein [Cellulomonas fengjieae]|uniref:Integral membrane protein n=1 Tax=Cellulomonas fengjieae TaxID=2819978 RepID=A0ABS3SKX0_9CELL|nr:hypothetical protein [Cellulomonas fengjieae]MBO3086129.1 hypothetical protein [Cellulomonas fengjieae]MBO3102467.1 hypothetical protein [Cellulomonas fengjieae]QVI65809.1 hypothetical protein KG102_17320 [Cellulomonas fengjieae]